MEVYRLYWNFSYGVELRGTTEHIALFSSLQSAKEAGEECEIGYLGGKPEGERWEWSESSADYWVEPRTWILIRRGPGEESYESVTWLRITKETLLY